MSIINLSKKFEKFSDHWALKVIAKMNDYQFKLVKVEGEFVWHSHEDTDEIFIVLNGEMAVVPRGVEHRPSAKKECQIMIVEPKNIVNTGGSSRRLTAENDVWI